MIGAAVGCTIGAAGCTEGVPSNDKRSLLPYDTGAAGGKAFMGISGVDIAGWGANGATGFDEKISLNRSVLEPNDGVGATGATAAAAGRAAGEAATGAGLAPKMSSKSSKDLPPLGAAAVVGAASGVVAPDGAESLPEPLLSSNSARR